MEMLVKTLAGLEEVLAREITDLGGQDVEVQTRAVTCQGDRELLYRLNLWLRTGLRVLVPIHQAQISNEQELYDSVREIDWGQYLTPDHTLAVDANTQSAQLDHSHFLALKTKDAVCDWFRDRTGRRPSVDTRHPHLRIHLHLDSLNHMTVLLDSSGDGLHRRGYRDQGGGAPLNEVLAAGLVLLSGWERDTPFVDFMCGSGTILIEAASYAYHLPPGRNRRFGFERWLDHDREAWQTIKHLAKDQERAFPHAIVGNDRDFRA
ncbi:MAG: class I SAM-dependent RNA methyltransferase, partial [Lewinella sp.]|nr:class I SAM-dependent RNA methyltransferase [Lewinella sp.]